MWLLVMWLLAMWLLAMWLLVLVLGHCRLGRAGFVPLWPLDYPNCPILLNLRRKGEK